MVEADGSHDQRTSRLGPQVHVVSTTGLTRTRVPESARKGIAQRVTNPVHTPFAEIRLFAPERFVEWVNHHLGFNPRAGKYSDALGMFVLDDLSAGSPVIKDHLDRGYARADPNADVTTLSATRNVDLVIWGPEG